MCVIGKPFHPGLVFVRKAKSLPKRGTPVRHCLQLSTGLTRKLNTRLAKDIRQTMNRLEYLEHLSGSPL